MSLFLDSWHACPYPCFLGVITDVTIGKESTNIKYLSKVIKHQVMIGYSTKFVTSTETNN